MNLYFGGLLVSIAGMAIGIFFGDFLKIKKFLDLSEN